jgi:DNA-directed RNA polymerase sigma subunit (sigma70/sigma32)
MNLADQLEAYQEIMDRVEPEWPVPPTAEDIIAAYYEEYPEEIEIEEPETKQYIPKEYFNQTVSEIAENLGMTVYDVRNMLQSSKRKLHRRLLILSLMDRVPDDEIGEILCDKGAVAVILKQEYR